MTDKSANVVILLAVLAASLISYAAGFLAGADTAKTIRLRSTCELSDLSGLKSAWYYLP